MPGAGAWHPGRLYDLLWVLPCPRATGDFQKPYIPIPRGCVNPSICACRCRYLGGCCPQQGVGGQVRLARVPQLFQLPHGHAPCHHLLQCLSS